MDCCNRPADHGERVAHSALAAIGGDVNSELSPSFRAAIVSFANQAQQSLPGVGATSPSWGDGAVCTPLERVIRTHFERVAEAGLSPAAHAAAALQPALAGWCEQRLRQVEQQVATKDKTAARAALTVARTAAMSTVAPQMAEILGASRISKRRARLSLHLDEDLRAQR